MKLEVRSKNEVEVEFKWEVGMESLSWNQVGNWNKVGSWNNVGVGNLELSWKLELSCKWELILN